MKAVGKVLLGVQCMHVDVHGERVTLWVDAM